VSATIEILRLAIFFSSGKHAPIGDGVNWPGFSLNAKLNQILKGQQNIVAAIDDLKKAVADLGTSVSAELDAISTKLANATPDASDADIEDVVGQIEALKEKVDAQTNTLSTPAGGSTVPTSTPVPNPLAAPGGTGDQTGTQTS